MQKSIALAIVLAALFIGVLSAVSRYPAPVHEQSNRIP